MLRWLDFPELFYEKWNLADGGLQDRLFGSSLARRTPLCLSGLMKPA